MDIDQNELARRAGVSRGWISRVETGAAAIQILEQWLLYADALQMDLFDLWFGPEPDIETADATAIDRALRNQEFAVHFATVAKDFNAADPDDRAWILSTLEIIARHKAAHRRVS